MMDPSELFLLIQTTLLRYPQNTGLLRQSLITVEALVRCCVGPTWEHQLRICRRRTTRTTDRTESLGGAVHGSPPPSPTSISSVRSRKSTASSMPDALMELVVTPRTPHEEEKTTSPASPSLLDPGPHRTVPELLPAALIRFCSFFQQDLPVDVVLPLQISVMLSLACDSTALQAKLSRDGPPFYLLGTQATAGQSLYHHPRRWSIVGVADDVDRMVRFWVSQLRDDGAEPEGSSRTSSLPVLRACALLLSHGWRPRGHDVGVLLVAAFLNAVVAHVDDVEAWDPAITDWAIRGLAVLGFHDLIPTEAVSTVAFYLCHFVSDDPNADAIFALHGLLQSEPTAELAVEALLLTSQHRTEQCKVPRWATGAVRVLTSALWGDAARNIRAIPLLRAFFVPTLQLLWQELASFCNAAHAASDDEFRNHGTEAHVCELLRGLSKVFQSQHGSEKWDALPYLSVLEWDSIVQNLDCSVVPWLRLASCATARNAATALILDVCKFLAHATDQETVPFAEYDLQLQLYQTLLRQIAPILNDDNDAILVCVCVIQSWLKFGLFPYRVEGWTETASTVLGAAFEKNQNGVYIHHSSIRLEALRGLTDEETSTENLIGSTGDPLGVSFSQRSSLLVLTQHMRELHLDLIRCSIVPFLSEVVAYSYETPCQCSVACIGELTTTTVGDLHGTAERLGSVVRPSTSASLELYSVRLSGRLYRSASGDRELRVRFISMLRSVALNCRVSVGIRFSAVIELHKCLEAAFVTLPHAHESIPDLINSLCDVFCLCTEGHSPGISLMDVCVLTVLGITAIDPLARLRVAIDQHVAFRANASLSFDVSGFLNSFFIEATSEYRSAVVETFGAPCVSIVGISRPSSTSTQVSFERIVASVLQYLQLDTPLYFEGTLASALALSQKCVRIHCFDILRHQFLASIPVCMTCGIAQAVFTAPANEVDEIIARSLALIRCAENAVILATSRGRDVDEVASESDLEFIPFVLDLVLDLLVGGVEEARVIACHGITAVLPGLHDLDKMFSSHLLMKVVGYVQNMLPTVQLSGSNQCSVLILTIVHDLLGVAFTIPGMMLRTLFLFAVTTISKAEVFPDCFSSHLATRCIASLLDRMTDIDFSLALRELGGIVISHCGTAEVISQLAKELGNRPCSEIEKSISENVEAPLAGDMERLSTEAANIEDFEVNRSATWLLSETVLLTCRSGALRTRYHGFIEVICRTMIGRSRLLIRVPNEASLIHPELPSRLRTPFKRLPTGKTKLQSSLSSGIPVDRPFDRTISEAESAMARFDTIMSQIAFEEDNGDLVLAGSSDKTNTTAGCMNTKGDILVWLHSVLPNRTRAEIEKVVSEIGAFVQTTTSVESKRLLVCDELDYPLQLQQGSKLDRAMAVLDRTPSSSTFKIGFLYDQSAEQHEALQNNSLETCLLMTKNCSPAFHRFANRLGCIVPCQHLRYFSGGLDTSSFQSDGRSALSWTDCDKTRSSVAARFIVFHVVSLMPHIDVEGSNMNRKRHIGNDNVLILFADRGSDAIVEFDLKGGDLIGGAFGFVVVWVTIAQPGIFRINVRVRKQRMNDALNSTLCHFVSDNAIAEEDAPCFVRNIAMRADLACRAATGAADAPSNYFYRFQLINEMARFACPRMPSGQEPA